MSVYQALGKSLLGFGRGRKAVTSTAGTSILRQQQQWQQTLQVNPVGFL